MSKQYFYVMLVCLISMLVTMVVVCETIKNQVM